jgi:hypothetical protein
MDWSQVIRQQELAELVFISLKPDGKQSVLTNYLGLKM